MPQIQTMIDTQRIMCFTKYTEDYFSPWKHILSFFLKDYGGKFLLHCNFSVADLPSCLPNFFRECFEVWCYLSAKPILSREQTLSRPLWNKQFSASVVNPFSTRRSSQKVSCLLPIS